MAAADLVDASGGSLFQRAVELRSHSLLRVLHRVGAEPGINAADSANRTACHHERSVGSKTSILGALQPLVRAVKGRDADEEPPVRRNALLQLITF